MSCAPCIWDKFRHLEPTWYGVAGGAAVAGAALFPGRRVVAGAIAAVAVLALGIARGGKCGCGDHAARPADAVPAAAATSPTSAAAETPSSSSYDYAYEGSAPPSAQEWAAGLFRGSGIPLEVARSCS